MCHNCGAKSDVYACKYCKRTQYCSKQCGEDHWYRAHKHECIGKDVQKDNVVDDMFDQLMDKLSHTPQPSSTQKERAAQYAMQLNGNNVHLAAADYAAWEQNVIDRHQRDAMMRFLDDYFASKGAPEAGVDILKENLNDADEIMSGLITDLAAGKEPNIASMIDHLNLATNMAVRLGGTREDDFEKVFVHSPQQEQELAETLLIQHALYITECFGTFSFNTRKSDEETVAYGFKPDLALEHDDENVIQSRIDQGLQPRPDWWDTRYDYFKRVPAYIGVLTPEEKLAQQKAEQTRRRRRYNPRTDRVEDFLSRDPNANVEVQNAQAQQLLDATFDHVTASPDAVLRAIETLMVRTGPLGRGKIKKRGTR